MKQKTIIKLVKGHETLPIIKLDSIFLNGKNCSNQTFCSKDSQLCSPELTQRLCQGWMLNSHPLSWSLIRPILVKIRLLVTNSDLFQTSFPKKSPNLDHIRPIQTIIGSTGHGRNKEEKIWTNEDDKGQGKLDILKELVGRQKTNWTMKKARKGSWQYCQAQFQFACLVPVRLNWD